jgi:hypothetical protein
MEEEKEQPTEAHFMAHFAIRNIAEAFESGVKEMGSKAEEMELREYTGLMWMTLATRHPEWAFALLEELHKDTGSTIGAETSDIIVELFPVRMEVPRG